MARRLIIAEENRDIAGMLHAYFEDRDYTVQTVESGPAVMETARAAIPNLVILSASLPDSDPDDIVRQIRAMPRTSHVPIICLAPRSRYNDFLSVLQAGADDCIAKPFDMEELGLRVENAVARTERENVVDPRSGLPGARLLHNRLQELSEASGWAYLDLTIAHFEPFREVNGFVASDQVLTMVPGLLRDVVLKYGTDDDYLSHPADDHFVLLTFASDPDALAADLVARFDEAALAHYSFMDREKGHLAVQRGDEVLEVPFMTLNARLIPPDQLGSASDF